jgi:hypothetical protein
MIACPCYPTFSKMYRFFVDDFVGDAGGVLKIGCEDWERKIKGCLRLWEGEIPARDRRNDEEGNAGMTKRGLQK